MKHGGFWGKILHVDLGTASHRVEQVAPDFFNTIIGGRGLIAWLLLKNSTPGTDPLGPGNPLVFAAGVLTGTGIPGAGRHSIGAKSPLTGRLASSEAGGFWGNEFKKCGFDALVIHGKSDRPVYIAINDEDVEIHSAAAIWGTATGETEHYIKEKHGDSKIRIAQCGIAGEKGVLFASVMHDITRAGGRSGLGAVMGSKNLKAVAVRGTGKVPAADQETLRKIARQFNSSFRDSMGWLMEYGTSGNLLTLNKLGALPTKNFSLPQFPNAEKIGGPAYKKNLVKKTETCHACPVACKQVVECPPEARFPDSELETLKPKPYGIDPLYGGPEYETIASFGSNCMIDDIVAIARANQLCGMYGIDTISMGATLAFAMECADKKLIPEDMLQGFTPEWGNADCLLEAIELTAFRKGFGDLMARGSKNMAEVIGNGSEKLLVEVKGQELAMHEPRFKYGHGLGVAISPTGADHMINIHDDLFSADWGIEPLKVFYDAKPVAPDILNSEKIKLFYYGLHKAHFFDSAVLCSFYPYSFTELAEIMTAVLGQPVNPEEIILMGERAHQLSRLFNIREGWTIEEDRLPARISTAFSTGPIEGQAVSPETLRKALLEFHGYMGWDEKGIPSAERLIKLGLSKYLAGVCCPEG